MVEKDVIVIGAGAAGLMCAIEAGKRGRRVAVLEQASQIGKKILISGGGRCNFTNLKVTSQNYLSQNEHFCKSALSRYSSSSFVALVEKHQIAYHEKKLGQLFCDVSAKDIVAMLKAECDQAKVQILTEQSVAALDKAENFIVKTQNQTYTAASVVIASGGLTVPKISSDIGYRVAKQYGLKIVNCRPALVPLTLSEEKRKKFAELSGISVDALVSCQDKTFRENILVTHWGLSGPAILQISSYWQNPDPIVIDLLPDIDILAVLTEKKEWNEKVELKNFLSQYFPKRFATTFCELYFRSKPLYQYSHSELEQIAKGLKEWEVVPSGTLGYDKAEVTLGGVDTDELSSKTMEAKKVPGLYFVGEIVDVTGWLGGFNFQWAWASGFAAGQFV